MLVLGALVILITSSIFTVARADDCDAVLARDYYDQSTDTKTMFSLLRLVVDQNFDQFKQKFTGNIIIPIDGVPVDFGSSWSSFHEKREQYINQLNINFSDETHQTVAVSSVPHDAREFWLKCKIEDKPGSLSLAIDSLSSDGSEIRITGRYNPQEGGGDGKYDSDNPYVLSANTTFLSGPPQKWKPNLDNTFSLKRNAKNEFFLKINLKNGHANKLELPPWDSNLLGPQCTARDADGNCARCEFEIDDFLDKAVNTGPILNICPGMKRDALVQAEFEAGFKVWFNPSATEFWPEVALQIQNGQKAYCCNEAFFPTPLSAQEFMVTLGTDGNDRVPVSRQVVAKITVDKCVFNTAPSCTLSAVPIAAHPAKPRLILKAVGG
jgi:hypothetical protein